MMLKGSVKLPRVEKYNQLLRIEEELADAAVYENPFL